ncbi:hypothetical protein ACWCPT_29780 [Streptomyces sp. NPDC002308]
MAVVVLYLALSLVVSAPFVVALFLTLLDEWREVREDRHPAVRSAELAVRAAYANVAALYDPPAAARGREAR